MMRKLSLPKVFLAAAIIALGGCSSSPDEEEVVVNNRSSQSLYEDAKEKMAIGNFNAATATLSALDSRYPFGQIGRAHV